MLLTLCAHFVEVVLFAVGWYYLLVTDMAILSGVVSGPTDILYFSLTTYTSLGYGDIAPLGPARLLAGIESLDRARADCVVGVLYVPQNAAPLVCARRGLR